MHFSWILFSHLLFYQLRSQFSIKCWTCSQSSHTSHNSCLTTKHSQGVLLSKDYSKWNHTRSDIIKDILSLREQTSLLNNPVISEQQVPSLLNVTSSFFMARITTGLVLHHQSESKVNGTNVTSLDRWWGSGQEALHLQAAAGIFQKSTASSSAQNFCPDLEIQSYKKNNNSSLSR